MSTTTSTVIYDRPELSDAIYSLPVGKIKYAFDKVMPMMKVTAKNGTLEAVTKASIITYTDLKRANTSADFTRVNAEIAPINYALDTYGGEYPEGVANGAVVQVDREKLALAVLKNKLNIEMEVLFESLTFGNDDVDEYTLAADWTDADTDIFTHIKAAMAEFASTNSFMPNCLVLSESNYALLMGNPSIAEKFAGAVIQTNGVVSGNLAGVLGLDKIVVSSAKKIVQSAETSIVGDDFALLCVSATDENSGPEDASIGRTLAYVNEQIITPYDVKTYFDNRAKSVVYQVEMTAAPVLFDAAFGLKIPVRVEEGS